jgi:mRNA interferase RelE/StbE
MAYRIELKPSAAKALSNLPKPVQKRVAAKIDALAVTPRPPGVTQLSGSERLYRVRSGEYRIIYQIRDEVLLILVIRIGHRREVYRNL